MDQKKIGSFLKELRKEKGITQEEFAEKMNVSGRTVSRWETGNNMPDISLLIEIADFFDVSISEIINGERKSEIMNEEVKEVADKLSDYATEEKKSMLKEIRNCSIIGTMAIVVYSVLELTGLVLRNIIFAKIAGYCETVALVTVIIIMGYTTGLIYKIHKKQNKNRISELPKSVQNVIIAIVSFAGAVILKWVLTNFFGL